jgi:hypothetical protein
VKLAKVLERFRVFLREQYERRQVLSFHTFEITNETIVSLVSYVVCRRLTRSETILIDPDVVLKYMDTVRRTLRTVCVTNIQNDREKIFAVRAFWQFAHFMHIGKWRIVLASDLGISPVLSCQSC